MSDKRRIILGILFILLVIVLGVMMYFLMFRGSLVEEDPGTTTDTTVGEFPIAGEFDGIIEDGQIGDIPVIPTDDDVPAGADSVANGGFTQTRVLTPDTVTDFPDVSSNGDLRYYGDDGRFYRVDDDGNIEQIGDAQFRGAENVTWSSASDEVVVEFPDGSNIYYDLETNTQATLPAEYEEFDFSPTADSIAFKFLPGNAENAAIGVASPTGANVQAIEGLGNNERNATINWSPTGRVVANYTEFVDLNRQEIGFVGLNDENYRGIVVSGRGFESEYSPDGRFMLYSTYSVESNYNPTLSLVEADGDRIGLNNTELNLQASAEDCVFSGDSSSIYCAVPANENLTGYGMVPELAEGTPTDIYRVDLRTGSRVRVAIPVNENGVDTYEAETLMLSLDDSRLYFRDRGTGEIVRIDLE